MKLKSHQVQTIQQLDNFLHNQDDHLYRLFWDCGTGKSYVLAHWIALHPDDSFLYVTVNHDVCQSFYGELMNAGISPNDICHFEGKRDSNCFQPKDMRYYPGCMFEGCYAHADYTYIEKNDTSYCKLDCPYKHQKKTARIILTVFQLIDQFAEDRIVIIDESPENIAVKTDYGYPSELVLDNRHAYEDKFCEEHIYYTNVQLKTTFEVKDARTWKLKKLFEQCRHNEVVAFPNPKGKGLFLYGRNYDIIPTNNKIIFSCATTSLPFMEELMGKAQVVDTYKVTIENHIVEVNTFWTKSHSELQFDWFKNEFLPSLGVSPSDVFISTKQMFADELRELGYTCAYHGNGRGVNTYSRQYKYVIAYCRFGAPIEANFALELLGFNHALVRQREVSESLQTFHRSRVHLYSKDTPIILMTNKELGLDATIDCPYATLQKVSSLDAIPNSLNKIAKELHISKRDAKAAQQIYKVLHQYDN